MRAKSLSNELNAKIFEQLLGIQFMGGGEKKKEKSLAWKSLGYNGFGAKRIKAAVTRPKNGRGGMKFLGPG